jgi:hypothetical protein
LNNELRAQYGREFQFEEAGEPLPQEEAGEPLPQEEAVGPGGYAPEVAIGPDGFTFGTSLSLGLKAYPDERKVEVADTLTWVRGRHQLQMGGDVSWCMTTSTL